VTVFAGLTCRQGGIVTENEMNSVACDDSHLWSDLPSLINLTFRQSAKMKGTVPGSRWN